MSGIAAIHHAHRPVASRRHILQPDHRKGPAGGRGPSVRMLVVVRRPAPGLVNRCLRPGDLDVGADRDPEAIRLVHNELDHPDLDTVRRMDNPVEPERSQPDDVKPCVRWHVIVDIREPGDVKVNEYRAGIAEGQGSTDV